MRLGDIELQFRADRTAIVQGTENPAVRVCMSVRPAGSEAAERQPVTLVVLLDCSGTMRSFRMDAGEAQRWIQTASNRSELRVVESDRRIVHQLTGQTLQDVRSSARCSLAVAASALEVLAAELRDSDVCCLVGFATRAGILFDGRRRFARNSFRDILKQIQDQPSSPNLGDGTRMQEACRIAASLLRGDASARRLRRLVLITDGIVEDDVDTLRELEEIRNEKVSVTTIGIGQEFNEEFLTRVADWTGGTYHYAPTAEDVQGRLKEDAGVLQAVAATELTVSARGMGDAVVTCVTQLIPQTRMFEEIRLKEDWYQVDVGEVHGGSGVTLMSEFSLPWLQAGRHAVGEVELEWRDPKTGTPQKSGHVVSVNCLPPNSPTPELDPEVEEMFMRLEVYRAERSAQWAQESGRPGVATVRLREASTILRHLGEGEWAKRFEQQASDLETNQPDSDRTKALKDWVRRLAQRKEEGEQEE
jgi:hypothetical protein